MIFVSVMYYHYKTTRIMDGIPGALIDEPAAEDKPVIADMEVDTKLTLREHAIVSAFDSLEVEQKTNMLESLTRKHHGLIRKTIRLFGPVAPLIFATFSEINASDFPHVEKFINALFERATSGYFIEREDAREFELHIFTTGESFTIGGGTETRYKGFYEVTYMQAVLDPARATSEHAIPYPKPLWITRCSDVWDCDGYVDVSLYVDDRRITRAVLFAAMNKLHTVAEPTTTTEPATYDTTLAPTFDF